jgi:hypothetical protein
MFNDTSRFLISGGERKENGREVLEGVKDELDGSVE